MDAVARRIPVDPPPPLPAPSGVEVARGLVLAQLAQRGEVSRAALTARASIAGLVEDHVVAALCQLSFEGRVGTRWNDGALYLHLVPRPS